MNFVSVYTMATMWTPVPQNFAPIMLVNRPFKTISGFMTSRDSIRVKKKAKVKFSLVAKALAMKINFRFGVTAATWFNPARKTVILIKAG